MPISIKGTAHGGGVIRPEPPAYWIQVKDNGRGWGTSSPYPWVSWPSLRAVRCLRTVGGQGRGRLEFYHNYGSSIFQNIDDGFESVEKLPDLEGFFVRVCVPFGSSGAKRVLFVGRVEAPLAEVEGDQTEDV
jgi:hypothetical protein